MSAEVSVAAIIVLAGGILYFWQFRDAVSNYQHFHGALASGPRCSRT